MVEKLEDGRVRLTFTSCLDLRLPVIPVWFLNWYVPTETKKWGVCLKAEVMRRLDGWKPTNQSYARLTGMFAPTICGSVGEAPTSQSETNDSANKAVDAPPALVGVHTSGKISEEA